MTNEEQKLREFAEKWGWFVKATSIDMTQFELNKDTEQCLSDLTALISENYVDKDIHDRLVERADELTTELEELKLKYDEVVQQRDELRELLKRFTECMRRYWADTYQEEAPDLSLVIEAEAAIKNTDG